VRSQNGEIIPAFLYPYYFKNQLWFFGKRIFLKFAKNADQGFYRSSINKIETICLKTYCCWAFPFLKMKGAGLECTLSMLVVSVCRTIEGILNAALNNDREIFRFYLASGRK